MKTENWKLKIILTIILVFFIGGVALPAHADLLPLVQCGLDTGPYSNPCTFCDFLGLVKRIIDFITTRFVPLVATLLFVVAGFMMLLGGADPEMINKGRGMLKYTLIGVVIIYASWLMANTVIQVLAGNDNRATSWFKLDCTKSFLPKVPGGTTAPSGGAGGGTPSGQWKPSSVESGELTDIEAEQYLISRSGSQINPAGLSTCPLESPPTEECGSYQGVKQSTLDEVVRLQKDCGCFITVNDATGPGHDADAGHYTGNKIDIQHSPTLDAKIMSYPPDPNHPGDSRYYKAPSGAVYFNEDSTHWDVYVP